MLRINKRLVFAFAITLQLLTFHPAIAGGGPENIFLVVNDGDQDSLTVANLFIRLRKIPADCVFYVNWPKPPHSADVAEFRKRILQPTLDAIDQRQLSQQIDYIIYSSGFPYAISFEAEQGDTFEQYPTGSITGLTYLYQYTLAGKLGSISGSQRFPASALNSNAYAKNLLEGAEGKTRAFRARDGLDVMGNRVAYGDVGQKYYLSMMLAHTGGNRNNNLDQIKRYLRNGVKADGTNPKGTIYFVRNANIRSKVRQPFFEDAVAHLQAIGINAEIVDGKDNEKEALPLNKQDIQGAMTGYYKLAWGLSNSQIQPGAIVENFTSFGGVMSGNHGQTMLSHFLRFGAVASSGTVVEPYSHAVKFPNPRIHVHYGKGCSVAEAYYQSVILPYQLLIVGDPLCQPWAVAPEVKLTGLNTKKAVEGQLKFRAAAKSKQGNKIRNLETFVDGRLLSRTLPDKDIVIDTSRLANGYHELRVVAVEDTPIETQGRFVTGFVTANRPEQNADKNPMLSVSATPLSKDGFLPRGRPGIVRVRSKGAREIRLYRGRELLGSVQGDSGRLAFETSKLGSGLVELRAVALPENRAYRPVFGFPFKVTVE